MMHVPAVHDFDVPVIELKNTTVIHKTRAGKLFRPDTVHANKNIDFKAYRNEVVGIVGESGCGKSTLARVMVGLQPVSAGEVLFKGQPLRARAKRKEIGKSISVVFQDPATSLNPRMTVREQLLDPLKIHGVARMPPATSGSLTWSTWWDCRSPHWRCCPGRYPVVSVSALPSPAH